MTAIPLAAEPLTTHVDLLGEGPVWDARTGRVIWTDIEGRVIHAIRADGTQYETWVMPDRVCSLGLTTRGRWVVAFPKSVQFFDPGSGIFDMLARIDHEPANVRLNDGKVGPDGAFWVGSMDENPDRQQIGSLYRVTADGKVEIKLDKAVHVSNGLAWSPDGATMFHSNSRGGWVDRYAFDSATGEMSDHTRIAAPDNDLGRPDGAACDALGRYWSAGVSAGYLNCFTPDGELVEHIKVPVAAPTMPCFGGEGLKMLFLTSLSAGVSAERLAAHPLTGRLLRLDVGVAGAPVSRFQERL